MPCFYRSRDHQSGHLWSCCVQGCLIQPAAHGGQGQVGVRRKMEEDQAIEAQFRTVLMPYTPAVLVYPTCLWFWACFIERMEGIEDECVWNMMDWGMEVVVEMEERVYPGGQGADSGVGWLYASTGQLMQWQITNSVCDNQRWQQKALPEKERSKVCWEWKPRRAICCSKACCIEEKKEMTTMKK